MKKTLYYLNQYYFHLFKNNLKYMYFLMSHPIIYQNVHFDFSCDQHQLTTRILYIDIFLYFRYLLLLLSKMRENIYIEESSC